MARVARAERRAQRAAMAGAPPLSPPKRPTGNGGDDAHRPRRGNFFAESWAELQKVEWPGQSQVIQATVVVLIACIVVGAYLYANDQLWQPVVKRLVGQ